MHARPLLASLGLSPALPDAGLVIPAQVRPPDVEGLNLVLDLPLLVRRGIGDLTLNAALVLYELLQDVERGVEHRLLRIDIPPLILRISQVQDMVATDGVATEPVPC